MAITDSSSNYIQYAYTYTTHTYVSLYICLSVCAKTKSCDLRLQLEYLKMPGEICMRQKEGKEGREGDGPSPSRDGHLSCNCL